MKISISQKIYSAFYLWFYALQGGPRGRISGFVPGHLSISSPCLLALRVWEKICSILSALGALPRRSEAGKTGLTSSPVNGATPGSAFCCMGQSSSGCRPAEGTRADVTPAGSVAVYPGSSRSICGSSFRPATPFEVITVRSPGNPADNKCISSQSMGTRLHVHSHTPFGACRDSYQLCFRSPLLRVSLCLSPALLFRVVLGHQE
jgi:hypothetical protein